LKGETAF
jgi:ankyrin repeat protein